MAKHKKTMTMPNERARTCLLVLGMHRSGTSAITRLVSMLGASLPQKMIGAGEGNEAGHWEPERLAIYHEQMLAGLGSAWHDWTALDLTIMPIGQLEQVAIDIADIIVQDYGDSPLFVVKEPRIARFAGFFARALARDSIEIRALIVFRNPLDVIESLIARKSLWPADHDRTDAVLLWLSHMLGAEKSARDWPHAIVSYEAVMANPADAVQRAIREIAIETPISVAEAAPDMTAFIDEGHRHHAHRPSDVLLDPQLAGWVADSYAALRDLEARRNIVEARETLDRVQRSFQSALPLLKASADSRRKAFADARIASQQAAESEEQSRQAVCERIALAAELERARADHEAELNKKETLLQSAIAVEKDLRQSHAASEAALASLSEELEQARQANEANLEFIHKAYRSSTSWKLTAPLRGIKSFTASKYRSVYSRSGLVLRSIFPDRIVHKIKTLVPDPHGIPLHLQVVLPRGPRTPPPIIARATDRPDVFVLSIIDWDFRTQRPQHIARLLAEKHRVFYIEMMLDMEGISIRQIDENLYVIRLGRNSIGHIQPYTGRPDDKKLRCWLDSFLDFADHVHATPFKHVIIQHPFWWQMARHLPQDFQVVFDCMDDIAGFSNTTEWLVETERSLLVGCDRLVVSSDYLFNKYRFIKPSTLIRNGGDLTHFEPDDSNASPPQLMVSRGFAKRSGIIAVGYVGAIAEWFDVDLVRTMANRNPDMEFHLCGAVTTPEAARLDSLANVTLYGEIPYSEVPAFIRQMEVMIIPFQLLPIIQACDPVKFYEYSAMGKPTVATELPELDRARELLFLSTDATEFAANIRKAQSQGRSPEFRDRLRTYAAGNTWRHRSDLFEQVLDDMPKVSVIVLSYGEPVWTVNTLHSLFAGGPTYPNMEVLLVDNGSSEEQLEVIREAMDRAPAQSVRLIENGENLGFARGNNVGIREATGDYVLLLNNDTYVPPGAIAAMVSHLRANPSIGVIGPMTNNIGNEARVEIHYANMAEMMQRARELVIGYRGRHSEMPVVAYFAAMLRRKDFEQFGLLSEDYGPGMFEDDDHCAQIRSKGYVCALAEDAFVHHHLSASFDAIGAERKQKLFEINKKVYEARWGKWIPHKYRKSRPASGLGGGR